MKANTRTKDTLEQMKSHLAKYDIITFDVFDTLITRCVLKPTDLFTVVEARAKQKGIVNHAFARDRQQAEHVAYAQYGETASFLQIYQVLQDSFSYSHSQCDALRELELQTELQLITPRRSVRELFYQLIQAGKRIILCSDMYLSSTQIQQLLVQCGYPEDLDIWVSCEKSGTKSSGVLWDKLFASLPEGQTTIHIGDNPDGDYRKLRQMGRDAILIDSGMALFQNSPLYGYLSKYIVDEIGSSLVLGYLINKALFNSPFSDIHTEADVVSVWGGAAFSCFMDFLVKNRDDSQLLFVTREGYLLKPMYERYCRQLGIQPQSSTVFYASRAATVSATITSPSDIVTAMMSPKYRGTAGNFAKSRFNFDLSADPKLCSMPVSLPEQKREVYENLKPYFPDMICNGKQQQEAYQVYTQSVRQDGKCLTVVDVGYNGTIQYALSKILGEKVNGLYLFLNDGALPAKNGCNCAGLANPRDGQHPIYDNLLFLEAVMQAPYGQLQKMELADGLPKPVFNADRSVSKEIPEIQEAFCTFVEWIAQWQCDTGDALHLSFELAEAIWICLLHFSCLPKSVLDSMWLADDFCGNPIWRYDVEKAKWQNGNGTATPLAFTLTRQGEKLGLKYAVKNSIKKHIPYFAYDFASRIWQKYFLQHNTYNKTQKQ